MAIGVVLTLTLLILFSLEGLYNGTHTLDEILFGAELGLFLAMFGQFYVKPKLDRHLTDLMDGMYVNRYRQIVLSFLIPFLALFMAISIAYLSVLATFRPPVQWMY